jgi:hypothetical protein
MQEYKGNMYSECVKNICFCNRRVVFLYSVQIKFYHLVFLKFLLLFDVFKMCKFLKACKRKTD